MTLTVEYNNSASAQPIVKIHTHYDVVNRRKLNYYIKR